MLADVDRLRLTADSQSSPADISFVATSLQHLGWGEEAASTLGELRGMFKDGKNSESLKWLYGAETQSPSTNPGASPTKPRSGERSYQELRLWESGRTVTGGARSSLRTQPAMQSHISLFPLSLLLQLGYNPGPRYLPIPKNICLISALRQMTSESLQIVQRFQ